MIRLPSRSRHTDTLFPSTTLFRSTDRAQWEALKRQVERYRDARLPLATDRSATALAAYRAGAPIRPWLDARRDQLDLLIEHTQRLEALGRTWAALAYLLTEEPQQ